MSSGKRKWLACALVAAGAVASCARVSEQRLGQAGALRGANVLLVTIDTLRKDRVGAFGNRDGLTPNLDRLATRGVRYTSAFSHTPMTLPAHTSLLTGLWPFHHGVRNNTGFRLNDRIPTLATRLKGAGYRTGAFLGAFVLDGRFGLGRGFDEYDDRFPADDHRSFHFAQRRAADVVGRAERWILAPNPPRPAPPWFAWVHLFDPHAPYDAPEEYRAVRSPYDAEVAYTDAMVGELLARLESAGALDHTIIVVTADHGESLGEHGETTHGLFAYDATIAVPLIISAAGLRPGAVDAPVGHTDLAPTILDLVGVPAAQSMDGQSLVHTPPADRPLYFEALDASLTRGWAPLRGVIQRGWKFIDLPDAELYDLAADPGEQQNRIADAAHRDMLTGALQRFSGPEASAPRVRLDTDTAARLRALGYTSGTAAHGRWTSADDPKRLVALNERFNSALTAFDSGRTAEALSVFRSLLRERPDFDAARASAATVLMAGHQDAAAVDLLREGLERGPSPDLLAKLGDALRATGNLTAAAEAFRKARAAGNENPDLVNQLAVLSAETGRPDEARALFRELVDQGPASALTWFNLGLFELQNRRPVDAAVALRRAVALDPSYGDAWNALGAALLADDKPGALEAWRHAERLRPDDYDLLFNLAMVLSETSAPSTAIPYLRRFVREAPPDRYRVDITQVRSVLQRLERDGR
jgi:arylsulfatase A-like enzyme/Flp pilus assembly protein TadD